MERLELNAEVREETGKGTARRLRREGLIPGVLYGRERQPVNLKLNAKKVDKLIGGNVILDLELDDDTTQPVMVKEVQRDVIKGDLLHIDLYQINLDEKVEIEVPVELVGPAAGEREGGILEQILRELEVACLPTDIPDTIKADVTELEVGQSLSVAELEVSDDIEILTDGDETIATVVVPTELDLEPAEAEEEELEEPEVIGEDVEEDEEAEVEEEEE
ncbi:50S ribosomal protein L25 [Natroniella sulfidigena]|uniref:50S ribosomal protein L25 n=1 Tax=Natroniella sulfidigena TaxID=723921 RepID=UPI00200B4977|nr:50S ribosomal protein L25 [Natroniella sulfidigena]MCK8817030.1 50S ribosomal protein L25 [Natroniella sulfidigena]